MADNELEEQTVSRLRSRYDSELSLALMKQFGYTNKFQVPKLEKISVNIGIG